MSLGMPMILIPSLMIYDHFKKDKTKNSSTVTLKHSDDHISTVNSKVTVPFGTISCPNCHKDDVKKIDESGFNYVCLRCGQIFTS